MRTLYTNKGLRLYCTADEVDIFLQQADALNTSQRLFCRVLAFTGCRISEALHLHHHHIDTAASCLVFETLKRRRKGLYRCVPVPTDLMNELNSHFKPYETTARLWPWSRTKAYEVVKGCFAAANMHGITATPKALRHAFAINALACDVPLNMVQKWLGHASIETTTIYTNAVDSEEQQIASRMWKRRVNSLSVKKG